MSYLEKLFLGTMILFLSVVLFFFGLYFDLYEMLLGGARQSDPLLSVGEFAYTRAAMERVARPIEIMPRSAANSDFNLPAGVAELSRLYSVAPPPMDSAQVVAYWRDRLKAGGMPEGDLLDLEALGHDREGYGELMVRVNALLRSKDYETAAGILEDGLKQTDPKNLYVLRDLMSSLIEAYQLGGRSSEADRVARQLTEVAEKILDLKAKATGNPEFSEAASEAARNRTTLHVMPVADEAAKTDMKARLLKAMEEGKISRSEMDEMLEQLK